MHGVRRGGTARLAVVFVAAGIALAAGGVARGADLVLDVTFNPPEPGTITVTLPGGGAVGTTSGAPTVIPDGCYSVQLSDTQGVSGPQFDLQGPGGVVIVQDNLFDGEVASGSDIAYLAPNTTFTWRNDQAPSVVYTFQTNGTAASDCSSEQSSGTSGTVSTGGTSSSAAGTSTTSSSDVVGSAIVPFRGTLLGTVSATGKLDLTFKDKRVSELVAGRYTVRVTDKSKTAGFILQAVDRSAITVTSIAYTGPRSTTVDLTEGQWFYYPSLVGKKTAFYVTS